MRGVDGIARTLKTDTVNEEETMLVKSVEDQGRRFMMVSSCQRG